jgi:hypothetical protein
MTRDRHEGDFGFDDSLDGEFGKLFSGKPDAVPVKSTYEVLEIKIGSRFAHIESEKMMRPDGESWFVAYWSTSRLGLSAVLRRGETRGEAVAKVTEDLLENGFGQS